jgi:hypothetical protein
VVREEYAEPGGHRKNSDRQKRDERMHRAASHRQYADWSLKTDSAKAGLEPMTFVAGVSANIQEARITENAGRLRRFALVEDLTSDDPAAKREGCCSAQWVPLTALPSERSLNDRLGQT